MQSHIGKKKKYWGGGEMAKVIEHLPSKCEVLSSSPTTTKKKKKMAGRLQGVAQC
jgi:hypothetical protein